MTEETTYRAARLDAETIDDLAALPSSSITYDDPQADNGARAGFAAEALVAYVRRVGDPGELETAVTDLLGDLRHLCDALGFDFGDVAEVSFCHYDAEIRGEL
ncbi:MazG-like nucleotide pyrophosphohydrolase [Mycobacterium phage OmniCritical]|nr:MazG-like nucleotide pyrophosphohydrolase [Mycobacterium phage OmniCritical]